MKNKRHSFKYARLLVLAAAVVLMISLSACGSDGDQSSWTREGDFTDENNNTLSIMPSDDEDYEGWYVGLMVGDDSYGWYITQDGDTLHGDLNGGLDEGDPYVVTIAEEGEDGVSVAVEGGDTYHFTPMDMSDVEDESGFVFINTEGSGQIAYAAEGEELAFNDEEPIQSTQITISGDCVYKFEAKPDDGAKFIKWTKDGEDYSTDAQITVEFSKGDSASFTAVFE